MGNEPTTQTVFSLYEKNCWVATKTRISLPPFVSAIAWLRKVSPGKIKTQLHQWIYFFLYATSILPVLSPQGIFGNDPIHHIRNHPSNPQQPIQQPYGRLTLTLDGSTMKKPPWFINPTMDTSSSDWWYGTFGLFFHILGMSSSHLTNIFHRVWNHQPVVIKDKTCQLSKRSGNETWPSGNPHLVRWLFDWSAQLMLISFSSGIALPATLTIGG